MIGQASFGNRDGIPGPIKSVYDFVQDNLHSYSICDAIEGKDSEKDLTSELCIHLNTIQINENGVIGIYFHHECPENRKSGHTRTTDFCAMTGNKVRLVKFEAKRLSNDLANNREKEYVVGRFEGECYKDSGGIERFKMQHHGNDVAFGGMIGYVQTGVESISEWHQKINTWVAEQIDTPNHHELTWDENDSLKLLNETMTPIGDTPTWVYSYQSKSSRLDLDVITFRHFWVVLN